MKATAKHWVKYDGAWHGKGEVFQIRSEDAEEMRQYAEIEEEAEPAVPKAEPARKARRRAE